jgi:hypothetical protein
MKRNLPDALGSIWKRIWKPQFHTPNSTPPSIPQAPTSHTQILHTLIPRTKPFTIPYQYIQSEVCTWYRKSSSCKSKKAIKILKSSKAKGKETDQNPNTNKYTHCHIRRSHLWFTNPIVTFWSPPNFPDWSTLIKPEIGFIHLCIICKYLKYCINIV